MTRSLASLADILDTGPDISDAPEADQEWSLLRDLESAAVMLAVKLKHEPGLRRSAAEYFCKANTQIPGVCFRLVWPRSRRLAGLPEHAKGGRPKKSNVKTGRPVS